MMMFRRPIHLPRVRRSFTLVEVLVATLIAAFLLGSVSISFAQLGRARESSNLRMVAYMRADAALNAMRSDIASTIRHHDLFWTRLHIRDRILRLRGVEYDRAEILVFNTRLRPIHDIDFNGEGMQYETHYRIQEDELGAVLWQRRDAMPDEYPFGGGTATPMVEGIISLRIEAYDGMRWFDEWDSDVRGLPEGVRITVVASGAGNADDLYDAPRATLRAVVPIDRVIPPPDIVLQEREDMQEMLEDVRDEEGAMAHRQQEQQMRGGGRSTADSAPGAQDPAQDAPQRGQPAQPQRQPGQRGGAGTGSGRSGPARGGGTGSSRGGGGAR